MKKTVQNNKNGKPEMTKFVVEAPVPTGDQEPSSGGLRENGKLAVHYKNPRPYKEPSQHSVPQKSSNKAAQTKSVHQNDFFHQAGKQLRDMAWQEIGKPLIQIGMQKLTKKIANKMDVLTKPNSSHSLSARNEPTIIDLSDEDITILEDHTHSLH